MARRRLQRGCTCKVPCPQHARRRRWWQQDRHVCQPRPRRWRPSGRLLANTAIAVGIVAVVAAGGLEQRADADGGKGGGPDRAGVAQSAKRQQAGGRQSRTEQQAMAAAVAYAREQLGKPYRWGAEGPDSFDCSGLTQAAYADAEVALPRVSWQQYRAGPRVEAGPGWRGLKPGDLIFFHTRDNGYEVSHVALYLGGMRMLHAPNRRSTVKVQPVTGYYRARFVGATRPAARAGAGPGGSP